jgi:iron(III) transport system ATP-binding protein
VSEAALTLTGCSKRFGAREVLRDVSLTLRCGEVTAALGRSGAGKSTLLRAIAGLERIDSGEISGPAGILSGGDAQGRAIHLPPERRRVGLVFQDYALFPHLTAVQNVMFGLRRMDRDARRARAMALLESVDLADRANTHPHALSGGEQQRVALARALAPAPQIVLLDEPFSGLDSALRESTREMALAALKASGAAALIVTHDAHEAMLTADALALMADGRIVQQGAPDDLYRRPASAAAARLLGDVNEWPGSVRGGLLDTPFGALAAPGMPDGAHAIALVRPEGMTLSPGGDHTIAERRFAGAEALLRVRAPDGTQWRACAAAAMAPQPGASVSVALDPALSSAIPA